MLDFIGIGLGPFNLSLASLLHNKSTLNYAIFEQKAQFDWHAGMQLPNTVLQVPFMADLVSMVDPTSPFSFLNYLRHQQRLYKFSVHDKFHRTLILSGFCLLKIAKISLNSSFFPKPIKR